MPFALRGLILLVLFAVAFRFMRDIGFTPEPRTSVLVQMRSIAVASAEYGWRVPPVRFLMLQALFTGGVAIYAFYALQPYLLELYGDPEAYQVAGLVAAIVAGAQIVGGLAAPSSDGCSGAARPLLTTGAIEVATLALIGLVDSLGGAGPDRRVGPHVRGGHPDSPELPQRPHPVPAARHRPVLRLDDGLARRRGGAAGLGRVADVWGYGSSYVASAGLTALSLPFVWLARRQHAVSDVVNRPGASPPGGAAGTGTS